MVRMGRLGAAVLALALGGCGSTDALKTVGTLAGSSAGAAVGKAINVSGPWGYAASIASSAVGGFAGNMITRVFIPDTSKAIETTLLTALSAPETGKPFVWGTPKDPQMGIVATTGGPFSSATGAVCRPFMVTVGMPVAATAPAEAAPATPATSGLQQVGQASAQVADVAKTTDQAASLGGDATRDIANAAGDVQSASKRVNQATSMLSGMLPGGKDGAKLPKQSFGTACKDDKGAWVTVKA